MVLRAESNQAGTSLDFMAQADYARISQDATLKDRLIASAVPNVSYTAYNVRENPSRCQGSPGAQHGN